MRVFWHQGPQEDRKSTEETETKQINLRWEFCWRQGPQEDRKSTEEANQLKMRVFWPQGPQEDRKSTEETETKQTNLRFLTPRPTRRQKKRRRDSNKANQLKIRVCWHESPQEDRKSTEETEAKQINLRWEFLDTKAHKKIERAQKRQKQSKPT